MKQRKFSIIILYLLILAVIAPFQVLAATRNAASCSYADVLAAYTAASNGDTVELPACAGTDWGASVLSIAKSDITIKGQGIDKTIIGGTGTAIQSRGVGEAANRLRITGIQFRNFNYGVLIYNNNAESPKNIRIDNNAFYNVYIAFENTGHITGVIDHNLFEDVRGSIIRLYGNDGPDRFPFTLGTSDSLFLEENAVLVNNNFPAHFITSRMGSRYVVRYNTFTYNKASGWVATIDTHGTYEGSLSDYRGSFTFEVYNNLFNGTAGANGKTFQFRGGQGVVFNNKIDSYNSNTPFLYLDDYRLADGNGFEGLCTVYPCRDQINNTYIWDNICKGGPLTISSRNEAFIKRGRDYFLNAPAGYTPYTYPHPLTVTPDQTPPPPPPAPAPDVQPAPIKTTPSVNAWPKASAITSGQALSASSLTGGTASVAGSFAFISPGTIPTATFNAAVTFTPSDTTSYNTVSGMVTVTVNPLKKSWWRR